MLKGATLMDYKEIIQIGNDIVLKDIKYFNLEQTLDNGQSFRWAKTENESCNSYSGIAFARRLELSVCGDDLYLKNTSLKEFEELWKNYFDLGRNYSNIHKCFSDDPKNEELIKALAFSPGLRMMRQDVWEVTVSFILSQNCNIPRIKKMINILCENFGERLSCGGYSFPSPQKLARLSIEDLAVIKSGYRAAYIIDAAKRFYDGRFDPNKLSLLSSDEIFKALLTIHGVGPKVADCVLLFGFGRVERFPLDVWMKKVMSNVYPDGFPENLKEYSGIAQQFLFHYARTNNLYQD